MPRSMKAERELEISSKKTPRLHSTARQVQGKTNMIAALHYINYLTYITHTACVDALQFVQ